MDQGSGLASPAIFDTACGNYSGLGICATACGTSELGGRIGWQGAELLTGLRFIEKIAAPELGSDEIDKIGGVGWDAAAVPGFDGASLNVGRQ